MSGHLLSQQTLTAHLLRARRRGRRGARQGSCLHSAYTLTPTQARDTRDPGGSPGEQEPQSLPSPPRAALGCAAQQLPRTVQGLRGTKVTYRLI